MTVQDNAAAMSDAVQVIEQAKPLKPHFSPTQISSYLRCGEAYRRYYIEKERFPPVLAMLKGTGMHQAAHVNFKQKKETHEDMPLEDVVAAAVAAFDTELDKSGVTLQKDELALGKEVAIGMARDDVANLAAGFRLYQAPDYQPIDTELTVRIPVDRGSRDLLGVIDLVAIVRDLPGQRVRDFKNSKRKKSSVDAAESGQLTFYAAAHQVYYGQPAQDVGLDVLVNTTKGVSRQELTDERDANDFMALAHTLNAVDKGIQSGIFLPSFQDKSAWWCSAKFCNYHSTCPFVNAQRINAATDGE